MRGYKAFTYSSTTTTLLPQAENKTKIMLKDLIPYVFYPVLVITIAFIGSQIYVLIVEIFRIIKARWLLLPEINEKTEKHYADDKVTFDELNKKMEQVMAAQTKRFREIDQKLNNYYSKDLVDSKFRERDIEIKSLHDRLDKFEENIGMRIDHSTRQILHELKELRENNRRE